MKVLLFLITAFAFSVHAAELDTYYLVPFLNGQPANGGYVPCDGTYYSGYWQNNEGRTIYVTKYVVRLSTNLTGGYTFSEIVLKVGSHWVGSVQSDERALNHAIDFAPDSYKVMPGAKIWIYVTCQSSGSAVAIPSWIGNYVSGPAVQGIAYAHFRDVP